MDTLAYHPNLADDGHRRASRDRWILGILTATTAALALAMYAMQLASWLEAVAFVSGAVCVWLTVKENIWNFPIGLINVAVFAVVFFRVGLFGDASLQIVYFVLGMIGWYFWLYGGERRTALTISRIGRVESVVVAAAGITLTLVLWRTLHLLGGSASSWDALTTSLSLCAQWLLNRKRLESWYCWIAVDIIYIPLYLWKDLRLTAILYVVFLCMATMGYLHWRATYRKRLSTAAPPAAAPMPAVMEASV